MLQITVLQYTKETLEFDWKWIPSKKEKIITPSFIGIGLIFLSIRYLFVSLLDPISIIFLLTGIILEVLGAILFGAFTTRFFVSFNARNLQLSVVKRQMRIFKESHLVSYSGMQLVTVSSPKKIAWSLFQPIQGEKLILLESRVEGRTLQLTFDDIQRHITDLFIRSKVILSSKISN